MKKFCCWHENNRTTHRMACINQKKTCFSLQSVCKKPSENLLKQQPNSQTAALEKIILIENYFEQIFTLSVKSKLKKILAF